MVVAGFDKYSRKEVSSSLYNYFGSAVWNSLGKVRVLINLQIDEYSIHK